jgi:hypothetical protein
MYEQTKSELAASIAAELDPSDPSRLAEEMRELYEIGRLALVARLRRLELFDRVDGGVDDGQVTSAAWQRTELGMNHATAKAELTVARVRRTCPLLSAVYEAGATTFRHVQAAAAAMRRLAQQEVWALLDDRIADWAQKTTLAEYAAMLDALVTQLLPEPKPKEQQQHEKRRFTVTRGFDGMLNAHGRFTPEAGEKLLSAMSAASRPDVDGETRTTGQRNADAIGHLLDTTLDNALLPIDGGEKPHITVLVPLDELAENAQPDPVQRDGSSLWQETAEQHEQRARAAGAAAEALSDKPRFAWTGPTGSSTARRLSCDGILLPIFTRDGQPIDAGRRSRVISAPLRSCIVVRDRHCRWPGCDMPARWTQVHHCWHWRDGAPTSKWNLLLLCEEHHRAAHSGLFVVVLHGPGLITTRPRRRGESYYEIRQPNPPPDDQPSITEMLTTAARHLRRV